MVIDGRTLPTNHRIEADLCIIGAGPAGIAVARELSGTPYRVCLLESGGLTPDRETQDLYRGRVVGQPYFRLDDCRVRRFGGSTNRWGGWTKGMDPIDFEKRSWVADSGWPITWDEVNARADRARAMLQLPSPADAMRDATERGGRKLLPLPADRIASGLLQFSPIINFSAPHRDALFAAPNVQTILYANATMLEATTARGAVERVTVKTLTGNTFTVTARMFVLAVGAIDNARLLLHSALGNETDNVGRYFTEHLHVRHGVLVANPGVDCSFYDEKQRRGREPMAWFIVPPDLVRARHLLAFSASLRQMRPAPLSWLRASQSPAYVSAHALAESLVRGRGAARWSLRLPLIFGGFGDVVQGIASRASLAPRRGRLFEINVRAEQAPNRESRVVLNRSRDPLGVPMVDLDWRLTRQDSSSVAENVAILGEACARSGVGQVFVPSPDDDVPMDAIKGGWHQMGTTRMSHDPQSGVVDEQCRVHGVANLYVAGSSVFPSCGFANPTFTILALALRLADHLRVRLAVPATPVAAVSSM